MLPQAENIVPFPTKSQEWYTPTAYADAARLVMNGIDLDPASCELANKTIRARRFYTAKQNGLEQDWTCESMWMNPPYGKLANKSMLTAWIRKLVDGYKAGTIKQAVLLATNNIEAPWFADLWEHPICLVDHEVRFLHPQGIRKCHLFGTTLTYLGTNEQKFMNVFSEFGPVIPANVAIRKRRVTLLSLWEVR